MPTDESMETLLLSLINTDRAELGLNALVVDQELMAAAVQHSADMVNQNYFSHTGQNGSSPGDRMADAGYSARGWGENIAWVSGNRDTVVDTAEVQRLHDNLMASPGHYANLMRANFQEVGLGLVATDGKVMLTEAFGTPTAAEAAESDKGLSDSAAPVPAEQPAVVPPVVVPPAEPPAVVPPVVAALPAVVTPDPEPEVRASVTGGAGRDTIQLDHAFHFNVDGGAGKDVISLGDDHGDLTVIMNAGQVNGDLIAGLDFNADDQLAFYGYGDNAAVNALGNGSFRVSDSEGHAERFTLLGVSDLATGDYVFA